MAKNDHSARHRLQQALSRLQTKFSSTPLNPSEQVYLENLLKHGDEVSLERAHSTLSHEHLFPPDANTIHPPALQRRDSHLQQELFTRHHAGRRPSRLLIQHQNSILDDGVEEQPFLILGQSEHPVATPPLLEALLQFVPEPSQHFWLKYSHEQGSNLWKHCRACTQVCIILETTDRLVFGAYFSSQSSFLFRLRHARSTDWDWQEAWQKETELQVFPCMQSEPAVHVSEEGTWTWGQGTLQEGDSPHYGAGLVIDASLRSGSTSTCATFGSPCLVNESVGGATFEIAAMEVWTLTSHVTVPEAEQAEVQSMFGGTKTVLQAFKE